MGHLSHTVLIIRTIFAKNQTNVIYEEYTDYFSL